MIYIHIHIHRISIYTIYEGSTKKKCPRVRLMVVLYFIVYYDMIGRRKKLTTEKNCWIRVWCEKHKTKFIKNYSCEHMYIFVLIFCCFYKTHNSLRSVWISVCDVINNNLKTSFHPVLYNFYEVHVWMDFFLPPFFLLNIYTGHQHFLNTWHWWMYKFMIGGT